MTSDLKRRLSEHNAGKSNYTKKYLPWEIIYCDKFDSREDARKREKYFKSTSGRKKVKQILNNRCPGSSVDRAAVS